MKKAIVLLFLIISAQAYANTYVGKLVTNIQESNGTITPFSLITDVGTIKLNVKERQFVRALYKLSGRVLMVSGEAKIDIDPGDLVNNNEDTLLTRMSRPEDFDWDFPGDVDPIDFDLADSIELSQYTVIIKMQQMSGTIRSEWGEGKENFFLKLPSGEDKLVTILQDAQNEFFEKYHNKEVTISGAAVEMQGKSTFVISQIELN